MINEINTITSIVQNVVTIATAIIFGCIAYMYNKRQNNLETYKFFNEQNENINNKIQIMYNFTNSLFYFLNQHILSQKQDDKIMLGQFIANSNINFNYKIYNLNLIFNDKIIVNYENLSDIYIDARNKATEIIAILNKQVIDDQDMFVLKTILNSLEVNKLKAEKSMEKIILELNTQLSKIIKDGGIKLEDKK